MNSLFLGLIALFFIIASYFFFKTYQTNSFFVNFFIFINKYILRHKYDLFDRSWCYRYCNSVLSDTTIVTAKIPSISSKSEKPHIDDIFSNSHIISLSSQKTHGITCDNFISRGSFLLLAGDAGSGKTTFLKKIVMNNCSYLLRDNFRTQIPFFIPLIEFISHSPARDFITDNTIIPPHVFFQFVFNRYTSLANDDRREVFNGIVSHSGILVAFDGLDEILPESRDNIILSLAAFSKFLDREGPNNKVIVSARSQMFEDLSATLEFFNDTLVFSPLQPDEIYRFLQRLLFAKVGLSRSLLDEIHKSIIDSALLRDLCSNFLVLSMYVIYYIKMLPPTDAMGKSDFFRLLVFEMLNRREIRGISSYVFVKSSRTSSLIEDKPKSRHELEYRVALTFLYDLSTFTIENNVGSSFVPFSDCIQILNSILKDSQVDAITEERHFSKALQEISNRTGMLEISFKHQQLRFSHSSIAEFLYADRAISRFNIDVINYAVPDFFNKIHLLSSFNNILVFFCGLGFAAEKFRNEDVKDKFLGSIYCQFGLDQETLASCILEMKAYRTVFFKKFMEEFRNRIIKDIVALSNERGSHTSDRQNLFALFQKTVLLYSSLVEESTSYLEGSDLLEVTAFLETLNRYARENRPIVENIVQLAAKFDPISAFKLADSLSVDIRKDNPTIFIESSINKDFLKSEVDSLFETDNLEKIINLSWLITESALRKPIVCEFLNSIKLHPSQFAVLFERLANKKGRPMRLSSPWLKYLNRNSVLSIVLQIATNYNTEAGSELYDNCRYTKLILDSRLIDWRSMASELIFTRVIMVLGTLFGLGFGYFSVRNQFSTLDMDLSPVAHLQSFTYSILVIFSTILLYIILKNLIIVFYARGVSEAMNRYYVFGLNHRKYSSPSFLSSIEVYASGGTTRSKKSVNRFLENRILFIIKKLLDSNEQERNSFNQLARYRLSIF